MDWVELAKRTTQGVIGALPYSPVQYCILAAGSAIAWAYTIELDLLVFYTFRRRTGLYFWSLLISSWGCALHALGFIFKFLVGTSWQIDLPFIEIGWVWMVTGQAFVLYSRLHLVVRNPRTLHLVLAMIITNAFVLHVPTIVFTAGANSPDATQWAERLNIMERIQLMGFCVQEFIISTIYILSTVRLLGSIYHSMTRKVMLQLVLINCICIGMDVVLIGLEFTNNYVGETSIKPMIYSIKLKLEFAVLNQLMGLTKAGFTEENHWRGDGANSHELRQRTGGTLASNAATVAGDIETLPAERKVGAWTSANAMRGSFSNTRMSTQHPEQIFKTQQVEVTTEPKPKSTSDVSSSTANTGTTAVSNTPADTALALTTPGINASNNEGTHPSTITTAGTGAPAEPPRKAKSLMGTPLVYMPGHHHRSGRRTGRQDRSDSTGRDISPSESEKEIFGTRRSDERKSEDSEKEGTRWIDGGGF